MGLVGGLVVRVAGLHRAYFNSLLMERAAGLGMGKVVGQVKGWALC